ncbi:WD40 repeat-like protein [Coniophora puteana RWD-64-598 SS2]|uniref:WD40 repeat-like protein n=1 Tax=Coniophora puteana (strain RWD-64-598) TaxID=741705 RepID=A0A5M3ME76_CONPW|nr:WD40 repeat-like protein [Coniophora puteana RWD-64-598 SS2]EIW76915.1 WD40 repeat-like protein [Coniophora puteana RWD-64-598 SS2]
MSPDLMPDLSEIQGQPVAETADVAHSIAQSQNAKPAGDEGQPKPFSGHTNGVWAVAYSPDGRRIATGSRDRTIRIWSSKTGKQEGETIKGPASAVRTLSYSPNGKFLVSGTYGQLLQFWDAGDGYKQVGDAVKAETRSLLSVQYSPDGKLVASAGGDSGKVKLWNALTHKLVVELDGSAGSEVYSVTWAPGGNRLAAASNDHQIRIFDVEKCKLAIPPINVHKGEVNVVAYSPNGAFLASGSDDRTIRIWGAETGKTAKGPFRWFGVASVAWSPDSQHLVAGSRSPDLVVCVWDVDKGQMLFNGSLHRHIGSIWAVAYSPDGKYFVSADNSSERADAGRIQVWDANTGKAVLPVISDAEQRELEEKNKGGPGRHVHFSNDGKMCAGEAVTGVVWFSDGELFVTSGADGGVQVWDSRTGLQVGEPFKQGPVNALSISADDKKLATASDDATVRLFDIESGELLLGPLTGHTGAVLAVKLAADGSRLVSGGNDGTIRCWEGDTGKMVHVLEAHTGPVCALSLSKDESKLASGAEDNTILIWDWQTFGRVAGPFRHDDCVRALCFSPDGTCLLSGSDDCTARAWNITTGNLVFDAIQIHSGPVGAVDWSSDGSTLLTAGTDDWTICVWNAATGERIHEPLEGHGGSLKAAAFSPDGERILSGSRDCTLCMWDVATGDILLEKTKSDSQNESVSPGRSPYEPQGDLRAGKRTTDLPRHSYDSFMEIPATVTRQSKQAHQVRNFWDDADHKGSESIQTTKPTENRQRKMGFLKGIWRIRQNESTSKHSAKLKDKSATYASAKGHVMRRIRRHGTRDKDVVTARDKPRVLAAAEKPRRRRNSQEEPESDEGSDSPEESEDPNPPDTRSGSDNESDHGLVDTVFFCLCIPHCK